MTIGLLFLILAIVLMILGAIPTGSKIDLWRLGWACVIIALAFGGIALHG